MLWQIALHKHCCQTAMEIDLKTFTNPLSFTPDNLEYWSLKDETLARVWEHLTCTRIQ